MRALHDLNNLSDRDYQAYFKLYELVLRQLPKPSLLIRLVAPVETLVERIQQRARSIEDTIDPDYLRLLDSYYQQWALEYAESPVLTINSELYDFVNNTSHLQEIIDGIERCITTQSSLSLIKPAM